ncbi:hypothetical protein K438DRAFT_1926715 [Mycena galopus ATCC 62051]|nr:hypothetical protein K438DRAFT_1926715 [Mycena galopus ATCC 62051]
MSRSAEAKRKNPPRIKLHPIASDTLMSKSLFGLVVQGLLTSGVYTGSGSSVYVSVGLQDACQDSRPWERRSVPNAFIIFSRRRATLRYSPDLPVSQPGWRRKPYHDMAWRGKGIVIGNGLQAPSTGPSSFKFKDLGMRGMPSARGTGITKKAQISAQQ